MTDEFFAKVLEREYDGVSPKELSPLVLAYIGDAVYELLARTRIVALGNAPVNKMNAQARQIVNAKAQSDAYFLMEEHLTQEELAVFKRGRNATSYTHPKNMDLTDYRHATGLEAVFGYLYLSGCRDRITELYELVYPLETEEKA
ncbi:Mini-ribonuclease 3 [bioreactor metagenome]|uniref:Mini-ribonuclease 3 n=1 Tax=bioreactor metagenome TaxID=1076179 RepID=A0A645D569_9ZZZZ|nr:ribonuclease III domain-containing protein [Candidatus Metalachnospira sp.]